MFGRLNTTEMFSEIDVTCVSEAFISKFYVVMHHTPELAYRFFKDSSTMRRPGPDGIMVTVNSMKGIYDLFLSLNCEEIKAEIFSYFAHAYMNGIVVFVMGSMTAKDNVKRYFTELFYLAPQQVGFFVLLDTFRFTGQNYVSEVSSVESAPPASVMPVQETATNGASLEVNPETLGRAFVGAYYDMLHKFPECIHKFYKDSSTMSRPGPDGTIVNVTAKKDPRYAQISKRINELMLSLNCKDSKAEILTIDSHSCANGVIILVTGCLLTRKDNQRSYFTESFCLAPQHQGFIVLNDTFRFVGEENSKEEKDAKSDTTAAPVNPVEEITEAASCAVNNCPQRQQRQEKPSTCLALGDAKETTTSIFEDEHNFAEYDIPDALKNSLDTLIDMMLKFT